MTPENLTIAHIDVKILFYLKKMFYCQFPQKRLKIPEKLSLALYVAHFDGEKTFLPLKICCFLGLISAKMLHDI